MEGETKMVCVTGGTGYIASWLIMRLLQQGFLVRTTIRPYSAGGKKDITHLTNLPGAEERLKILEADLNKPYSFLAAIEGCMGVFHVAHPMGFEDSEGEGTETERSVSSTLGILQICLDSKTVKRVVCTSSAYAVAFNNKGLDLMDENSWTDTDFVRTLYPGGASYILSKTAAERAALEFADAHGMDLVTLIPSLVTGPFLLPHCPRTVYTSLALILGNREEYKYLNNAIMVHIDDLASAYIFLLQHPEAKGRYICSSVNMTIEELADFLRAKYPTECQVALTDCLKEDIEGFKISGLSSKKLLDLGFKYKYSIDDIYEGAIKSCRERGLSL